MARIGTHTFWDLLQAVASLVYCHLASVAKHNFVGLYAVPLSAHCTKRLFVLRPLSQLVNQLL
jgi:hypothetical protein